MSDELGKKGLQRIELRPVRAGDLDTFFEHQLDARARCMAAFGSADPGERAAFVARWERLLEDAGVDARTITCDGRVAGHVAEFGRDGRREVTYWLGRESWGRGVASAALALFLARPRGVHANEVLWARAAADNAASIRVLRKCGFEIVERARGFAPARGEEVDEVVMQHRAGALRDAGTDDDDAMR